MQTGPARRRGDSGPEVRAICDCLITTGDLLGEADIYTTEVENTLYAHPAVLEVAVVGVPHEQWGEAVHAEVVPKAGVSVTSEVLIAHCRTLIAGYKVPRSVNIRSDALPKSGAGKILKKDLRAPFWEGRERGVN